MQRTPVGIKKEPIDVDEFSDDDIEEVTPAPAPKRTKHVHSHRLKKPKKPAPGSTSANAIELSDSEGDSIVVANSLNTNTNGHARVSGNARAGPSQGVRSHKNGQMSGNGRGRGIVAPMAHMRLQNLVAPAESPSPRKTAPVPGPSTRSSNALDDTLQIKMDVDSPEFALSAAMPDDDSSSSEEFWEWSDYAKSDEDMDLDDYIDIEDALKKLEPVHSPSPYNRPYESRYMKRAETARMRIQPEGFRNKVRPHRLWHTIRPAHHSDTRAPLITDYRELQRPRSGLLSRRPPSYHRNAFNCWLNIPSLRYTSPQLKLFRTSGSINKIVQSHEFIAVASPSKGGSPDLDMTSGPPEVDTYNREGNLVAWWGQKHILLNGHSRRWSVEEGSLRRSVKYYTVNDVAFDPLKPNRLVSSGNDRAVRVVDLEVCGDTFSSRNVHTFHYINKPYDIAFKPRSSLFAVSCLDGKIHVHKKDVKFSLKVSKDHDSRPGTFIWGASSSNGRLSNMLFASTESDKEDVCRHIAFDVETKRAEYELDINDSGDAMALDPQGKTLALVTSTGTNNEHTLSLFDVGHNNGARVAGTRLHTLKPDSRMHPKLPLETTHASFSPDGILLALARNDHRVHVYDVRYLSERPWAELVHPPVERPRDEYEEYGVTGLQWVEGMCVGVRGGGGRGGLGLVTGGADDCVRLWDVMRAPQHPDESMVLARVDHDVACFSVGDLSKNEHRLVVGDCAGEVYIYD